MPYGSDVDERCWSDADVVVDEDIDCFRFLGDKKRRNQGVRLIVNNKEKEKEEHVSVLFMQINGR